MENGNLEELGAQLDASTGGELSEYSDVFTAGRKLMKKGKYLGIMAKLKSLKDGEEESVRRVVAFGVEGGLTSMQNDVVMGCLSAHRNVLRRIYRHYCNVASCVHHAHRTRYGLSSSSSSSSSCLFALNCLPSTVCPQLFACLN